MHHNLGPRVLLALASLFAVSIAHAGVQTISDASAIAPWLLTPGTGLSVVDGPFLNELTSAGLTDPGGGIVLTTGLASEVDQPATVTVNRNLSRSGLTFLEGIAGAPADTGRDAVMLELVLQAGPQVSRAAFDFRFATDEPAGSTALTAFNDVFAARLFRPAGSTTGLNIALHEGAPITINAAPLTDASHDVFGRSTDLLTVQFDVTPGEQFRLIFMLSDIGNGAGDSAVYLSNLHAVPEPSTSALLASGLFAALLWSARSRRSVTARRP
jgi:hypothetical protein